MKSKLTIVLVTILIICLVAAGCDGMTLPMSGGSSSAAAADEMSTETDETAATDEDASDVPPPEEGAHPEDEAAATDDATPEESADETTDIPLPEDGTETDGAEGTAPEGENEAPATYDTLTFADGQELPDGSIMSFEASVQKGENWFFITELKLAIVNVQNNSDGSNSTSSKEYYAYDIDARESFEVAIGSEGAKIKGAYNAATGEITGVVTMDGKEYDYVMNEVELPFDDSEFGPASHESADDVGHASSEPDSHSSHTDTDEGYDVPDPESDGDTFDE